MKIEFFRNKKYQQIGGAINQIVPNNRRIGDCQTSISDGSLEIPEEMKVTELEKLLKDQFHLKAQVFRRSGNTWLQTTMTDSWTLKKQNEHGKEISQPTHIPWITESDNDKIDND